MFRIEFSHPKTGETHVANIQEGTVKNCVKEAFEGSGRLQGCVVSRILQDGKIIPLPVTMDDQQRALHGIPGAAEKAKADLERFYEKCAA